MVVQVRFATLGDIDEIVGLWVNFTEEMGLEIKTKAEIERWTDNRLRPQIQDSKVMVAALGQELVGFIGAIDHSHQDWVPNGIIYVVDLYVAPHARTSQAAQCLYRTAKNNVWHHYPETWANTHVLNHRMQIILKRWGFQPLHSFIIPGTYDQYYYRRLNPEFRPAKTEG